MAKHCQKDPKVCRGASYCSCQCDDCFEEHYGRPRTPEEQEQLKKPFGNLPPVSNHMQPYLGRQMVILECRHANGTLDFKGEQPPSVRGRHSPGVMTFDEVYDLYFRDRDIKRPEDRNATASWQELEAWLKEKGWWIRAKTW